jgi:glycerol-3-phosphate dehydrogenase (NAD(P)+)
VTSSDLGTSTPTRCAVFGTGSWGTAFSLVLADAGTRATLWGRRPELVRAIAETNQNPDYLPGIELPPGIEPTTDPARALAGADFMILAVPSQLLRESLTRWREHIAPHTVLVSLVKGVELHTTLRMSEVIAEVTGAGPDRIAVVTGPNLAREIAERQPAAAVVACSDHDVAVRFQEACHSPYFRAYTNTDVVGCELGGAVKNVIALAVGIADGMGLGDNAKALLVTRGLAETARLGAKLGADPYTFSGLAGMGDLVSTCASPLSRNRSFGEMLGRGLSVARAVASTRQVAEGVKSCEAVLELARHHGVDMPITAAVAAVVHDGRSPADMVKDLMSRSAKPERGD